MISPSGIVIDSDPNYGVGRTVDCIIRDQARNPMSGSALLAEKVFPTNADPKLSEGVFRSTNSRN